MEPADATTLSAPHSCATPPVAKSVVVLLSTMRSGSTLLKALLAQAPDVSDLPETDFQRFADGGDPAALEALSAAPILLLKRPAWFNEVARYPRLPEVPGLRRIVLVRDAYENLLSLRRMMFRHLPFLVRTGLGNRFLGQRYWLGVNQRLVTLAAADPATTRLVRYEDVLRDPVGETAKLFAFMGSAQRDGVSSYGKPDGYEWKWGRDDGGEKIKSLQVQPPRPPVYDDPKLLAAIKDSAALQRLRQELRYPELP